MAYDYRNSSVEEDRAAAEKVEARANARAKEQHTNGYQSETEQGKGVDEGQGSEGGEEDAAARTVQKSYRLVKRMDRRGVSVCADGAWDGV